MIDGVPYRQIGQLRRGGMVCVADHASNFVPEDYAPRVQAYNGSQSWCDGW